MHRTHSVRRLAIVVGVLAAGGVLASYLVAEKPGPRDFDFIALPLAMAVAGALGWGAVRFAAWVIAGFRNPDA